MPSPYQAPSLWQRLIFGPATLPPETVPGKCDVQVTQEIKKSTPATPGKNGQQTTTLGLKNAECKAKITIPDGIATNGTSYYDLLLAEWAKVYPPKAPGQCSHGAFGPVGMTDGQITKYDGLETEDGKIVLSFSFEGWISPKSLAGQGNATKKADAADPGKQWMSKYLNSASGKITPGTPGNVTPTGQKVNGPGIPLGEIQPPTDPAP
jgi:hypothetical protein